MKNLTFITGGVRSGKSVFAEKLATQRQGKVLYVATMPKLPGDAEQTRRIANHQQRRPSEWITVEESYNLSSIIADLSDGYTTVIIDCLSVYVSNILLASMHFQSTNDPYAYENEVMAAVDRLLEAIAAQKAFGIIVVSNEAGSGVVPETPLGRAFRDFLGLANQKLAAQAQEVFLTCCGLPLRLKPQKDL